MTNGCPEVMLTLRIYYIANYGQIRSLLQVVKVMQVSFVRNMCYAVGKPFLCRYRGTRTTGTTSSICPYNSLASAPCASTGSMATPPWGTLHPRAPGTGKSRRTPGGRSLCKVYLANLSLTTLPHSRQSPRQSHFFQSHSLQSHSLQSHSHQTHSPISLPLTKFTCQSPSRQSLSLANITLTKAHSL
jgi:hypothetical protein